MFNIREDRRCTYNIILRRVRETIFAVEKQEVLHMRVCVCVWAALVIQHAKRMRNIILSRVDCLTPHYLINGTMFFKKVAGRKMGFDCLCKFYLNIYHFKNNSARYRKCKKVFL
jgi:hypothetical protein